MEITCGNPFPETITITITIRYNDIDLAKATKSGLDFMLEVLIAQEWYEKAAEVRDELRNR